MAVTGARPATRIGVLGRRSHPRPRRAVPVRARRPANRRAKATGISSLLVAIAAAAGLCLFYLSQSTHVAAMGYQIDGLQSRISALQAEQQQLILQIGQARSPRTIEQRAKDLLHLVPLDQSVVTFAPSSTDRPR
jgi:cell division protein FtsB